MYPYLGSVFVRMVDPKWETNAPFYKGYAHMASSLRFSVGVIGGAYLSSRMGGFHFGTGSDSGHAAFFSPDAPGFRLVVGGVALVYGSRIAGGCTSGHGISGMAQLSVASLVTVAAMFGAGTLSAFVLGPVFVA